MNCEYSDVIMLMDSNHKLRGEITELKKEIELLKTKLQRDDEILKDQAKIKICLTTRIIFGTLTELNILSIVLTMIQT